MHTLEFRAGLAIRTTRHLPSGLVHQSGWDLLFKAMLLLFHCWPLPATASVDKMSSGSSKAAQCHPGLLQEKMSFTTNHPSPKLPSPSLGCSSREAGEQSTGEDFQCHFPHHRPLKLLECPMADEIQRHLPQPPRSQRHSSQGKNGSIIGLVLRF